MNPKINSVQQVLKRGEMLLIDSSFDVLNVLDCGISLNFSEYDMNLLISKKQVFLICENLLYPIFKNMKNMKNITLISGDMYQYLKNNRIFIHEAAEIISKEKILKLGLTNMSLSRHFKNVATYTFISPAKTLSVVKSQEEIKNIKKVLKLIKKADSLIPEMLKEGMTDVELRNRIDEKIYELKSERRFVPTMVGFDSKTQYPSLIGENLKKGMVVLVDIGAMKNGAGLNMSRSFAFGKIDTKRKKVLEIARMAIDVMASKCTSGVRICDIDVEYRHFLKAHKMLEYSPDFSVKIPMSSFYENINSTTDKTLLYSGSVIKLSANIFLPGEFGVREDGIYLIKPKGAVKID